jgi:hypothetical protein
MKKVENIPAHNAEIRNNQNRGARDQGIISKADTLFNEPPAQHRLATITCAGAMFLSLALPAPAAPSRFYRLITPWRP